MKVLTISGSLRRASINSALLQALAQLAAPEIQVQHFSGMAELTLFNPDNENQPPAAVLALHVAIEWADVVVIASPEYAHGVTGVIKNALDWCVGFEGFVNKPVVVLQARARSQFADAALRETLKTMSARLLEAASINVPLTSSSFSLVAMMATPEVVNALRLCLSEMASALDLALIDQ